MLVHTPCVVAKPLTARQQAAVAAYMAAPATALSPRTIKRAFAYLVAEDGRSTRRATAQDVAAALTVTAVGALLNMPMTNSLDCVQRGSDGDMHTLLHLFASAPSKGATKGVVVRFADVLVALYALSSASAVDKLRFAITAAERPPPAGSGSSALISPRQLNRALKVAMQCTAI